MALDEASAAFISAFAASGAKPLHEQSVSDLRAGAAAAARMSPSGPAVSSVVEHSVPVDGGHIAVRAYEPEAPTAAILFFHGGGWVLGTLDESDLLARTLAVRNNALVLSVDYRLAPEHPFPTATNDAWASLLWAAEHLAAREDGLPLVLLGESSGANLAAVVAQRAQREGGPRILSQVLLYPAMDCDVDRPSYLDPANQLTLSRDAMMWFWDHYADGDQRTDPAASPLRADDLTGLPPAVIVTAEHDPLRDEGEEYADLLRSAGVAVEHRRFHGQIHGFVGMLGVLPGAAAGMDYLAEHIGASVKGNEGVRS